MNSLILIITIGGFPDRDLHVYEHDAQAEV